MIVSLCLFYLVFSLFSVFLLLWRDWCVSCSSLMSPPPGFPPQRILIVCLEVFLFTAVPLSASILTCWWCLSPEILYGSIQHPPKDLFCRWAFRSLPALDFGKWQLNLSLRFESNDTTLFQYQSRDVSYQTCGILLIEVSLMTEPYSGRL